MTGSAGTDSVAVFGYINVLKDCDASVQWTLFMPGLVSYQQQDSGIRVQHFEYKILPALRLIGAEKGWTSRTGTASGGAFSRRTRLFPQNDHKQGIPYLSQFAFARFAGDVDSMLREEGFDGNAMYDITRNIILGQDVCIPYPDKYWTAEVYLDGFGSKSTAYLFSVEK